MDNRSCRYNQSHLKPKFNNDTADLERRLADEDYARAKSSEMATSLRPIADATDHAIYSKDRPSDAIPLALRRTRRETHKPNRYIYES